MRFTTRTGTDGRHDSSIILFKQCGGRASQAPTRTQPARPPPSPSALWRPLPVTRAKEFESRTSATLLHNPTSQRRLTAQSRTAGGAQARTAIRFSSSALQTRPTRECLIERQGLSGRENTALWELKPDLSDAAERSCLALSRLRRVAVCQSAPVILSSCTRV